MGNNKIKLCLLLGFFILFWGITGALGMMVLWFVLLGGFSIFLIIKNKNTEKRDIIIALILGSVSMLSDVWMGFITIPTYMAATSVFRTGSHRVEVIKKGKKQVAVSLMIALIAGILLGIVNILLAGYEWDASIKMKWLLDAMRAGITEEIAFRFFFFALCVHIVGEKKLSKFENVLCYMIMIIPHVLIHFPNGTVDIGSAVVLSVLFGLPFALLQRKRDLTSAIVSHATVDLIRFVMLGI